MSNFNIKSITFKSIENDNIEIKMNKENIKQVKSVERFNKIICDIHYKPYNGHYDNSDGFKLPDRFISKNGKFDTSKKYIGLKDDNWRRNRKYGYVNGKTKNFSPNSKGKIQGTGIKYKSRTLPKLTIKTNKVLTEAEEVRQNRFWALDDENPVNTDSLYPTPIYLEFLNEDQIMKFYESTYDFLEDEMEYFEDPDNINFWLDNNIRHTQGLVYLSYVSDAVSALGTAAGAYFWYKMCGDLITTFRASSDSNIIDYLKETMFDVISVLVVFSKYYNDKISLMEAIAILSGYAITKQYLNDLIPMIRNLFSTLVPVDSSSRHTQGANMTTFAQGVISIIGAVFLGQVNQEINYKNVMASVKSLGSTLLTVTTCESVLCQIIKMLPDILMEMLCHAFPSIGLYVHVSTDKKFKEFMDKTIDLHGKKPLHILYNSHNLHKFLELYDYMENYILTKENMARGLDQLLSSYIEWFDKVHNMADKLGLLPGKRQLPFVIWLGGSPGIGKSTMAKDLAKTFLREFVKTETGEELTDGEAMSMIYSHATSNKYFDGYHNQPVLILNDYLQYTTAEEEQWLIRFVDTVDVPLEVSSVDNDKMGIKGEVRFTSRIIIVTSNNMYLNSSTTISTVSALNRRRDVLVRMSWKDQNRLIDFDNFDYKWVRFIYEPKHPGINEDHKYIAFESKDMFYEDILRRYKSFLSRSHQVLEITGYSCADENLLQRKSLNDKFLRNSWTLLFHKLKLTVKDILSTVLFSVSQGKIKITVQHLLQLCTVGTVLYAGYKASVHLFVNRVSQSLSGDVSTRKYMPERKPLKRYTMGASQNIQSVCAKISKNTCKITTYVELDDKRLVQQTMWGLFVSGSLLVTPKHLWYRGDTIPDEGSKVIIDYKGIRYEVKFYKDNIFFDLDRDLACFNTLGEIPLSSSIEHLLMSEKINIDYQGEDGFLILPYNDTIITNSVKAYISNSPYIDDYGGSYLGKEIWQYNIKTVQGNCGSILIITTKEKTVIAGMHVAGDSYSGNSEILDDIFIQEAKASFVRKTQGFASDAVYDDDEYFDAQSDFDEGFIFLGKSKKAPFQVTKSTIVKGPLYEVLQPHLTEPAVLKPSDPRLEKTVSPILKSVAKYGTHIKKFDSTLMEKAFQIVSSFYDVIDKNDMVVFSHNDAINSKYTKFLEPLDIKTSAGYPWNINRKTKKDLIDKDNGVLTIKQELQDRINTCENMLDKRTMFPYTLTTTLKDERVAISKVKIGKTRTFMNFPVEYTILMRKYFDAFIDKETEFAREIGTTVGVNIYSSKWNDLYEELKQFDYHLDGDFKAFDGSIRPEFFVLYARLVNSFYNDEYSNHRQLLTQGCCFAPIFILDKVYMKLQGNPSGSRITTSFNSFVNRMYVVMSILDVIPPAYKTVEFFQTNMKMYAHGDDHLIGFSKKLENYWGGLTLRDFMVSHGIDYTSSQKELELVDHRPLEQCYYLKSYFVYNKDTRKIMCGLDKSVIQEMVSWQRDETYISTKMILTTSLRYAYFWGRDYFNDIRNKIVQALSNKKLRIKLPYFEDLENEYLYDGQLDFSYNYRNDKV